MIQYGHTAWLRRSLKANNAYPQSVPKKPSESILNAQFNYAPKFLPEERREHVLLHPHTCITHAKAQTETDDAVMLRFRILAQHQPTYSSTSYLSSHICVLINFVRQLCDGDLKSRLNIVEDLGIRIRTNHRNCKSFCTKTTCTPNTMQIRVCIT